MTHITVPDQNPFLEVAVTTLQTSFPFTFTYFDKTDLRVTVDALELDQSAFDVNGTAGYEGGYPGGTVVLHSGVTNCSVQIWSAVPPVRINDFVEGAGFSALSVNTELDRLTGRQRDMRLRLQRTPVLTKASSTTLAASDAGQLFTNKNKSGTLMLTLPPASLGLKFEGAVVAAFSFGFTAAGGDTVNGGASIASSVPGSYIELVATDDTTWSIKSKNGTWA